MDRMDGLRDVIRRSGVGGSVGMIMEGILRIRGMSDGGVWFWYGRFVDVGGGMICMVLSPGEDNRRL